ncbi:glycosyltransferase [Cryobacterium sp. Y82]|uniref:glycosyltransferase family protein n=1 Tax=Cryobacterium sp. Y82 TaxID=2045017 RepID=UPI000CE2CA8F|nr:glycosyltransferase [Cryobacterium sp. Y82]
MNQLGSRVLYLPNEAGEWRQQGLRLGLARLAAGQLIGDVRIFSPLWRLQNGESDVFGQLAQLVHDFQPHIVLVQHPERSELYGRHWQELRQLAEFTLVLHEGDLYDRWHRPPPRELRSAAAYADVAFSVGASAQLDFLRRCGVPDVRWVPTAFNSDQFGHAPLPLDRPFDVVLIGNANGSRIPLHSMPGARERAQLVAAFQKRFGKRFAVYGRGWTGPSAQGPIDFLDQGRAVQSGWITASWEHFTTESRSFSDRLPIALASGTVHVTSTKPGFDDVFPPGQQFLHHEPNVSEIVHRVAAILGTTSPGQRMAAAAAGRQFAFDHFRQDDNLVTLLNAGGARIDPARATEIWKIAAPALHEL